MRKILIGILSFIDGSGAFGPIAVPAGVALPSSCLVHHDKQTGCDVYVLGCLHGSPTSGKDVQRLINDVAPAAVVLELCDARYNSLRKDVLKPDALETQTASERISKVASSWWCGLKRTYEKRGLGQAALTGVLSGTYAMQKMLDFDPGLEFKTAMRMSSTHNFDLVMGDRDINETLDRMASKKKKSRSGAVDLLNNGDFAEVLARSKRAGQSLAEDASSIGIAVWGDKGENMEWPAQINMFTSVFGRREVLADLAGLLGPVSLVMCALSAAAEQILGRTFEMASAAGGTADAVAMDAFMSTFVNTANVAILVATSALLLRFSRLVIIERDVYLARALSETCQLHPGKPIIAVVGLLHTNGISKLLRNGNLASPERDS